MLIHNYMKALYLFFLLLPSVVFAQKKEVSVRIVQDESVLLSSYQTDIILKKKSFKFQVFLDNVAGIYVFAAFSDSICCRLAELDSISGFNDLPNRTMHEPDFNEDKELLVNDNNSCSYWFYSKGGNYQGFNRKVTLLDNGIVVAVKSVKQLYHVPSQKEIKVKEIDQPLYLLFVAVSDFDKDGRPVKELMRRKVKIDWKKDN